MFVTSPIGIVVLMICIFAVRFASYFHFPSSGFGIDCHRHHEALLAGAIPIIWKNDLVINPMFGQCRDVLLVDRNNFSFVSEISPRLYYQIKSEAGRAGKVDCRYFNLAQYWIDKIEDSRLKYRIKL